MEQGMSHEETVRKSKVAPYFFGQYRKQAAGLSVPRLKRIIYALAGINLKTRSVSINDWSVLEEEIVFLITASGEAMDTKS